MAEESSVVLGSISRVAAANSSPCLAGSNDDTRNDLRSGWHERGFATSRYLQRLDHAHQGAHRHAHDRSADSPGDQSLGFRPGEDRGNWREHRDGTEGYSGDYECLRGADHGRVFPRLRHQAGRPGSLWLDDRRRGDGADVKLLSGPGMIRDENGRLSGYVYVDVTGRDIGGYVRDAKKAVFDKVKVPPGYQLVWSGQYEYMERVAERLKLVVPITLFIVFLLLYFNTRSIAKTFIILLAVPFSAVGAVWFLYFLGYNMSIAVWVGLIALLGVDAETAVFMLLYLDLAYHDAKEKGQMRSWNDLRESIVQGAVKRLRPKVMTVACMGFGLVPIMWSTGAGADVMKRIAVPMIGGIFTSFLLELVVYPPIFAIWKWNGEVKPELRKLGSPSV